VFSLEFCIRLPSPTARPNRLLSAHSGLPSGFIGANHIFKPDRQSRKMNTIDDTILNTDSEEGYVWTAVDCNDKCVIQYGDDFFMEE